MSPLWQHFESIHIIPATGLTARLYPPAQDVLVLVKWCLVFQRALGG